MLNEGEYSERATTTTTTIITIIRRAAATITRTLAQC